MVNELIKNTGRFVLLILLQGLILNDVSLWQGMAIPYLYVLFLLMLPLETPRWAELLIGLACGLGVDMFTNTIGMHTSACVFLAYIRPLFLKGIAPRDGYEFGVKASISDLGVVWYAKYAFVLIFLHHFWLLFLEVYSLTGLFNTLLRVFLSTCFTFLLVILSQYLTLPGRSASRV
jgi:rod shape-determining protein MreD